VFVKSTMNVYQNQTFVPTSGHGFEYVGGITWDVGAEHWASYHHEAFISRGSYDSVFVVVNSGSGLSSEEYEAMARAAQIQLREKLVSLYRKALAAARVADDLSRDPIPYLYLLREEVSLTRIRRTAYGTCSVANCFRPIWSRGILCPGWSSPATTLW